MKVKCTIEVDGKVYSAETTEDEQERVDASDVGHVAASVFSAISAVEEDLPLDYLLSSTIIALNSPPFDNKAVAKMIDGEEHH